ncbi:hypothetical protein JTB14_035730 [Gonioctena quinquepunctata]|nr:hypothetical protein JTB14_035730 [Gonioctena quinquepunctata]
MTEDSIDYSKYFSFHIFTFRILGFWKPDEDMRYKTIYNLYTILCTTIWVTFIFSQLIFMFTSLSNMDEITSVIYVVGTITIDLIKMLAIYSNMDKIKALLGKLNNPCFQPKCEEHYNLAMKLKKTHSRLFYVCLYFGIQTYFCFSAVPFFHAEKVTLTPGWFPFNWSVPPNYELVYAFQDSVILWNTLICLNLDTFTSGLLMQVGLQCDFLVVTLNNIDKFHARDGVLHQNDESTTVGWKDTPEKFTSEMTKNLIVCIVHYKKIKRLAKEIEDIHRISVFILFVGGALVICADLFQLTVVQTGGIECLLFASFLVCMLLEQFMYCWFGNEIIYKSEKIFTSLYNTPWLDCDLSYQKILLNFMTQTVKPIDLKAGGLFTMSISAFVSVLRSAYSYYTLLQRIQEK